MMKKLKKEIADALGVLLGDEKQAKEFIDALENESIVKYRKWGF